MSEVLNAEVTSSEEGGLSRRRIVKGAAWSVPVIAAAIAAPAASASGFNVAAAFDLPTGTVPYPEERASGHNRTGIGPTGFHIVNSGAAISSSISGQITIQPTTAATTDPAIGIRSLTGATMTGPILSGTVFTASFTIPGIAANINHPVSVGFYYRGQKTQKRSFTMLVTFTSPTGLNLAPLTTTLELV
ncbi:hypothetical protein PV761_17765 [Arthrobacter sp. CC3]|uniref:hypothetical protein n=1 Tax=Arthrobacter sp. CC3 TaxID=3029185 RepID=UPI003265FD1D